MRFKVPVALIKKLQKEKELQPSKGEEFEELQEALDDATKSN